LWRGIAVNGKSRIRWNGSQVAPQELEAADGIALGSSFPVV
jgi:hypothetical protein